MIPTFRPLALLLLAGGFSSVRAQDASLPTRPITPPRIWGADPRDLADVKQKLGAGDPRWVDRTHRLRVMAAKLAKESPVSVVDKPWIPAGGNEHDYVSLARYYWPDPTRPGGKPYLRRDGQTNPEIERFDEPKLARMSDRVATLALAYYLTDHEPFAEQAARQVRTWFLDPATRMNPNMKFAQFVPGRNDGRGAGILDARELMEVADAVGMIQGSPAWTSADDAGVKEWFRSLLRWLRTSEPGRSEAAARNNHGTWYDAQICHYALFTGDLSAARQRLEEVKRSRIARQIEPSGAQPEELKRTTSFDYSVFNLEALFALATLARPLGIDLWNYETADGRSLGRAVAYLVPSASGAAAWPHEQIHEPKTLNCGFMLRRAAKNLRQPPDRRVADELIRRAVKLDNRDFLYPDWTTPAR